MKTRTFALFIFLVSFAATQAKIKVASVLGDNMVLQRNTEVKLWGKADPNQKLSIVADWIKAKINVACNEQGDWLIKLKTTEAGGPYAITIASANEKMILKNILLGEVWLCSGQSNMEMPLIGFPGQPVNGSNDFLLNADNDNIRLFTVKRNPCDTPQDTCTGKWQAASSESVASFSAVGYLYAKILQQKLKVPVGIINSSWSGTRIQPWMSKETIAKFPVSLAQIASKDTPAHQKASATYNGMIAPIHNFAIKGAIWYQGEGNIGSKEYPALMEAMVANWRKDFGVGQFPFYFVQIAPYWYNNSKGINSAIQRDEQLKASLLIPNCGMISTMDMGEEKCIHPAEKELVAKRLAYWAFAETYGFKGLSYKTPYLSNFSLKDTLAILKFQNAPNGFSTFGKEVQSFEIAGQDSVFYPAEYKISSSQIQVWSQKVKVPVAVRYGFCNFPKTSGYLYNTAGLPVPSFRTDNWLK
jgi:sialate O-acetylesterase